MAEDDIQADGEQDPDYMNEAYVPYEEIEDDTKDKDKPEIEFDEQVCVRLNFNRFLSGNYCFVIL